MLARTLLLPALLLFLAGGASAAEFEPQLLGGDGAPVRTVRTREMTGDGLLEVVAVASGAEGPEVRIYVPDAGGRYPRTASVTFRTGGDGASEVYYAALVRLAAARPAELLVVDRRGGVQVAGVVAGEDGTFALGSFRRIADAPPLPFPPDPTELPLLDVGFDLDGDGAEELVLPSAEGYRVYGIGDAKGGESSITVVPLAPVLSAGEAPHRFFRLDWDLPRLTVADWDGDRLPDLIGGHRDRLVLFLQTKDDTFYEASRPLGILARDEESEERTETALGDVNGDGRVDLVVASHAARTDPLERFSTRFSLYLNPRVFEPGGGGRLSTPTASFVLPGVGVNPVLLDFDGDGDRDLLVTVLDITPGSRLRKAVQAEYRLYRFDAKKGTFEADAFFTESRPYPAEQLDRGSTAPVCFFGGDFDGDGAKDLLDLADEGRIAIHLGRPNTGLFSSSRYGFREEAAFAATMRLSNEVIVGRLGGRDADDVVAWRGDRIYVIRKVR